MFLQQIDTFIVQSDMVVESVGGRPLEGLRFPADQVQEQVTLCNARKHPNNLHLLNLLPWDEHGPPTKTPVYDPILPDLHYTEKHGPSAPTNG